MTIIAEINEIENRKKNQWNQNLVSKQKKNLPENENTEINKSEMKEERHYC